MELVLMIPEGKPAFMGIVYDVAFSSDLEVARWIRSSKGCFQLWLDPSHELILWLEKEGSRIRMSAKYDPVALLKFVMEVKGAFNFGFLYRVDGSYKVIESGGAKMVLKVDKLKLEPQMINVGR